MVEEELLFILPLALAPALLLAVDMACRSGKNLCSCSLVWWW